MSKRIGITLGGITNSATSRVQRFYSQVKDALLTIITTATVKGTSKGILDIEGEYLTIELEADNANRTVAGRLVWEAYNQEEPIEVNTGYGYSESLAQAAVQVVDSYYEVIDKTPPEAIRKARQDK